MKRLTHLLIVYAALLVVLLTFQPVAPRARAQTGPGYVDALGTQAALNTQAKWLLLTHAFERLDCIAVEFRTHYHNRQSRRAIERLGAKLDGVLRSHRVMADGSLRDTCVYSVVASEWPTVRLLLNANLVSSV